MSAKRQPLEPRIDDGGIIHLYGGGPACPGCGGSTHGVTTQPAKRPWWCKDCNVRLDDTSQTGSHATYPADVDPAAED